MATLAETLRQVGYVTPQGQVTGPNAPLAQQLKNYVTNVIPTAAQNLAQQRADIDAALIMGQNGIQVGDRAAFERQMAQVPNLMGTTLYHGTKQFFDEFNPKKSFGRLNVTWFSPEQKFAQKYAGKEGVVIPVESNLKKTFDFTNADDLEILRKKAQSIEIYDPIRGSMTLDKKIPDVSDLGNYKYAENPQIFKLIKDMGYDSVAVTEDGIKNIGVFNPKKTLTRKEIIKQELEKVSK